jgi:hypothetical protein
VIYRDGADRAGQRLPFSALDRLDPEDLWKYMEVYERATGGQVLAIPHNSNPSNGLYLRAPTTRAVSSRRASGSTRSSSV